MEASIGVNLRVTAHSNQGGRKYMEDMFCVAYQPTADDRDLLYAYFGIFDGHGGREAALYAKHHLMDQIVQQKNFWSDDDELVLKAIKDGFISTHYAMWKELEKWPKTPSGLPSTSGTTASIAFVRRGKLYIGHVGDSGIVMGYEDPETGFWKAKPLTKDHKPESPPETLRIMEAGGKVIVKSGVPRVVWNRPRIGHRGPVRRSTHMDEIPFLAVARSLGDLWSYNSEQDEFVVSPQPDVSVMDIDVHSHRCLILGTDGLWNMLTPQDAVNSVYFAEKNNERQPPPSQGGGDLSKSWINPSKRLVDRALDRWLQHGLRADNTSVVTVVVDPPGPPKDPGVSPVGISRYVPQKPNVGCSPCSISKIKDKGDATVQPTSSSASPKPAVSHPHHRVIPPKTAAPPTVDTVPVVSSNRSVCRSQTSKKGKGKKKMKTSAVIRYNPNESVAGTSDDDYLRQTTECRKECEKYAPYYDAIFRSGRHSSTPIGSDKPPNDIQIHEISSSSEAACTTPVPKVSSTRKRKQDEPISQFNQTEKPNNKHPRHELRSEPQQSSVPPVMGRSTRSTSVILRRTVTDVPNASTPLKKKNTTRLSRSKVTSIQSKCQSSTAVIKKSAAKKILAKNKEKKRKGKTVSSSSNTGLRSLRSTSKPEPRKLRNREVK